MIASGYEQHPGLAENAEQRIKRTDAENLLLRLDREQAATLRFATDLRSPFTKAVSDA